MLKIVQTEQSEITKLVCPKCSEKVPRVGLTKNSKIQGLTFKCRKCGTLWSVSTD